MSGFFSSRVLRARERRARWYWVLTLPSPPSQGWNCRAHDGHRAPLHSGPVQFKQGDIVEGTGHLCQQITSWMAFHGFQAVFQPEEPSRAAQLVVVPASTRAIRRDPGRMGVFHAQSCALAGSCSLLQYSEREVPVSHGRSVSFSSTRASPSGKWPPYTAFCHRADFQGKDGPWERSWPGGWPFRESQSLPIYWGSSRPAAKGFCLSNGGEGFFWLTVLLAGNGPGNRTSRGFWSSEALRIRTASS